ncbi:hypothetical protein [Falsiroseomonas sp.]|uniref:hypothetical protein n=1 Tax=Falsiroseomonas sp. TaxID=2870721 RepID=UPI00356992CB
MWKVLAGGVICGIVGVLVFRQGLTTVMFHHFDLLQWLLPAALRPVATGYVLSLTGPFGTPQLIHLCFWGAVWGLVLVGLLRLGNLPDLLTGFLLGAVVCTYVGFTLEVGTRGMPFWTGGYMPAWISVALINGAWGWGSAGLMRAAGLVVRRRR